MVMEREPFMVMGERAIYGNGREPFMVMGESHLPYLQC